MTGIDQAGAALETQAGFCDSLGSPFTARILRALAADVADAGPVARLLEPFGEEPEAAALALRLAGAFHRRALDAPESPLGRLYPTNGGDGGERLDEAALRALLVGDLRAHEPHYAHYLESPPQTNEVGRSGVLIGGYLTLAAETGLPLDVCEIGASAGLNLGFDRFHYQLGDAQFGDPASPVHLVPDWHGGLPPVDAKLNVRTRKGCDIAPLDVRLPETGARLESYVWADQPERMARLRGALSLAKALETVVEKESADIFVARALAAREPGAVLVIAHTVMWQYMPEAVRNSIEEAIGKAGEAGDAAAPIAWLRFEPDTPASVPGLRLTVWPGGATRELAVAHPHGASVKWL